MAPGVEPSTVPVTVRTYTDDFMNERGKKIQCYYWEPSERPRALLQINHGFTDHAMMYEKLAQEMATRRFFVFAQDHMGHGRSEGRRAQMTSVHHLVEDAMTHIEKTKKKFPDTPLFMFGHSMGGAISILTALKEPTNLRGIVVLAPALSPNPITATPFKIAAAKLLSHLIPQFPVTFADVSLSCRDKEQLEKLTNDPLRHHGYFMARPVACLLSAGEEVLKNGSSLQVPYLILHGDNDKVCHVSGSKTLHECSSSKDKTLIVYPGAYHSLYQEPEEVSVDVFNKSVQWFDERA